MGTRYSGRASWWRRTVGVRRALLVVVVVATALLLRLLSQGVPEAWLVRLEEALSTEQYAVDLENVSFTFRRGLEAARLRLTPTGSEAQAIAVLERATLRFRWRWGEPLPKWLHSLDVQKAVLAYLPVREGAGRASLPAFGPVVVRCGEATVLGTTFRDVYAVITCAEQRLEVERIRCDLSPPRHPEESVTGEFSFGLVDAAVRGAASGSLNPSRLVPLLRATGLHRVPDIIGRLTLTAEPATMRLRLDYAPGDHRRKLEVALSAVACAYQAVPLMSGRATVVAEGSNEWDSVRIEQLLVERPEGSARGVLAFDLIKNGLQFSAQSTLDPQHLAGIIGVLHEGQMDGWKFGRPAEIVASGYYGFGDEGNLTSIEGTARAPSLGIHRMRLENVATSFGVTSEKFLFPKLTATAYGGECEMYGEIQRSHSGERRFEFDGILRKAQLGAVSGAIMKRETDVPGTLDLEVQLGGDLATNTLRSLRGAGKASVRDALLYRMPLFVGFTDFMARNVPGVDFIVSQNDLDAEFTVADFGMKLTRLQIEGSVFSVSGDGDYWFTDHLDIAVRVHLLKQRTWVGRILKVALFPVSKLFEFELQGPLSAPAWSPTTLALRGRRGSTDAQRGVEKPIPDKGTGAKP